MQNIFQSTTLRSIFILSHQGTRNSILVNYHLIISKNSTASICFSIFSATCCGLCNLLGHFFFREEWGEPSLMHSKTCDCNCISNYVLIRVYTTYLLKPFKDHYQSDPCSKYKLMNPSNCEIER